LLAFIHFSPEGMSHGDHRRLVRRLWANGRRVLCFSLHSPSLRPGFTSYVSTEGELDAFLDCCRATFAYLVGECGCSPMTMLELRRMIAQGASEGTSGVR